MGQMEDFRQHFVPIVAQTSFLHDPISQDSPRGWGIADLGNQRPLQTCQTLPVSR